MSDDKKSGKGAPTPDQQSAVLTRVLESTARNSEAIDRLTDLVAGLREDMRQSREDMAKMDASHREAMESMETRHHEAMEKMDARHREDMARLLDVQNRILETLGELKGEMRATLSSPLHLANNAGHCLLGGEER